MPIWVGEITLILKPQQYTTFFTFKSQTTSWHCENPYSSQVSLMSRISGIALTRNQTLSYRWIELRPTQTLTLTTQKRFLLKVCVAPSLKLAKRWRKARRSHCRTRSLQACGKPCNGPPHPETPWDRECDRIASCPQPTPRCSEESRRHGRWSWWGCCAARSGLSTREYSF